MRVILIMTVQRHRTQLHVHLHYSESIEVLRFKANYHEQQTVYKCVRI